MNPCQLDVYRLSSSRAVSRRCAGTLKTRTAYSSAYARVTANRPAPVAASHAARPARWALVVALTLTAAALPAGAPHDNELLRQHGQARALALKSESVARQAKVDFLAERYRRPANEVRAVVDAAEQAGARHGLPPSLLLAMVETESSFNQEARSAYGARGLMQVVPRFHPAEIKAAGGAHRLDEPATNIDVGARILARYLDRSGDLRRALAKYSGGSAGYAAKVMKRKLNLEQIAISATRHLDSPLAFDDGRGQRNEAALPDAPTQGSSAVEAPGIGKRAARPASGVTDLPASADATERPAPRS